MHYPYHSIVTAFFSWEFFDLGGFLIVTVFIQSRFLYTDIRFISNKTIFFNIFLGCMNTDESRDLKGGSRAHSGPPRRRTRTGSSPRSCWCLTLQSKRSRRIFVQLVSLEIKTINSPIYQEARVAEFCVHCIMKILAGSFCMNYFK